MHKPLRIDRRFLYWLSRSLYARRTAAAPSIHSVQRLLLVRVDERIGNLITLQSLIDDLRRTVPNLELGLLGSIRKASVLHSLSEVDHVHEIDKRWFFLKPLRWNRVLREVRRIGYEVAIDCSAWPEFSFTHAALTYFSGAPMRIGYDRGADMGFHTHEVRHGPRNEYELKQRMRLLGPLGMEGEPARVRTSMGAESQQRWGRWFSEHLVERPRIGIWAGSRKLERRWPVPFYVQLGRRLQLRFNANLVILWGPGEEKIRDQITRVIAEDLIVAPPTQMEDLAGLIRGLDLIVTNDTGPMHLSVAVGTKTVALFASGEPTRWGHPYPDVRNLFTPGRDPAEVERAADVCGELLTPCAGAGR
jgi:heptosyltransferase III